MTLSTHHQIAGHFKLERIKASTGEVVQTLEFKNLITDIGLNQIGTGASANSYTYVSNNSTPPSVLDTALAGLVAATGTLQTSTSNSTSSSPYWTESSIVRRFGAGAAAGNLTKVGVGWSVSSTNALFSSALIVDGAGNPTTLTVLPDEFLDVTYTLRYYPPLGDSTYTVVLNGTTYTFTARAASITSRYINPTYGMTLGGGTPITVYGGASVALGPLTGTITGSSDTASGGIITAVPYVNNSLRVTGSVSMGLAQGNVAGGITALNVPLIPATMSCATQMRISPAIPKDNTKTLSITFAVSWSRYP